MMVSKYIIERGEMEYEIYINEYNELWITPQDENDNSYRLLDISLKPYSEKEIEKAINDWLKG